MKQISTILFVVFSFLILLASCEEYYTPKLEVVPGMLVVESRLTNDLNQNFVKLSMTQDFYNTSSVEKIVGAKVELNQINSEIINGIEIGAGYFTFPKTPIAGKKYLLRIIYQTNIYESESVVMPPLPSIDTLYTIHKIEKEYRTDAYGVPELFEVPGRQICIDAPISPNLEYYRFNWRAIIQWDYNPPSQFGPPPPSLHGWKSRYANGIFNIAGPKEFSNSDKVTKHPILSLEYDTRAFLDSTSQIPVGWIVIIDQYGIQKESYDFHEKLNIQLTAEGSLFDPVLSQVYGNFHCRNNPSKIILGFFDLNSYRQYRYFLRLGINEQSQVIQRRINRYPDIPSGGYLIGTYPSFWENSY